MNCCSALLQPIPYLSLYARVRSHISCTSGEYYAVVRQTQRRSATAIGKGTMRFAPLMLVCGTKSETMMPFKTKLNMPFKTKDATRTVRRDRKAQTLREVLMKNVLPLGDPDPYKTPIFPYCTQSSRQAVVMSSGIAWRH